MRLFGAKDWIWIGIMSLLGTGFSFGMLNGLIWWLRHLAALHQS